MAQKTTIQWTDVTWNPTRGCTIVSAGCSNCYAMKQAHRFSGKGKSYEGLTRLTKHGPVWTGKVKLVPELIEQPLRWKKPARIFVNSMSDLFHEAVPFDFIDQVFHTMGACEWIERGHVFQILTKRPERMLNYMLQRGHRAWNGTRLGGEKYPPTNVHLGVSVEDQATADERIPLLLQTPAAVRFISAEPLLGPIDLVYAANQECKHEEASTEPDTGALICRRCDENSEFDLDWVIVGGESGPGARPMHPDWARSLRDQCATAGVPFFFKQFGEWVDYGNVGASGWRKVRDTGDDSAIGYMIDEHENRISKDLPTRYPFRSERNIGPCMVRVGKKAAGAVLDCREHKEFPTTGK